MDSTPRTPEYQESTTIKFEWALHGLKNLFDSSKGDAKSKVIKSARFGGGRWQILFYANSGTTNAEGQTFVSLYLSCEPTAEEKQNSVNGKWVREGQFKFGLELRNLQKTILFNNKEAHDHSFSYKTQNWGWAQFARRDLVYYHPYLVRQQDAFLIICNITSSPSAPVPPPTIPHHPVPMDLLDAMGSLLDDPLYSDVEFVLPKRVDGSLTSDVKRIYATQRLLRRVEYFDTMFGSGFAESSSSHPNLEIQVNRSRSVDSLVLEESSNRNDEDSDDEGSDDEMVIDTDTDLAREQQPQDHAHNDMQLPTEPEPPAESTEDSGASESASMSWVPVASNEQDQQDTDEHADESACNVRAKRSHPLTPRTQVPERALQSREEHQGPRKVRVVVRDVAYSTYRAVLYYIYTDTIVFAPLSSSFLVPSESTPKTSATVSGSTSASQTNPSFVQRQLENVASASPTSREEWIAQWQQTNGTTRPRPCSAKSTYRLADRLDLQELKERAFQHIVKSLTVDNVPYEVFSTFSATYEDIRKVHVRFFLDHWNEIRESDAMRYVWQQIRLGRHPGFEEVWPVIALSLEFKPRPVESTGGDVRDGTAAES